MNAKVLISEPTLSAWLLILSSIIFMAGAIMFTGRAIWNWPIGERPAYLIWERSLVAAAILVNLLGMGLFERMLEAAGAGSLPLIAILIYFTAVVMTIVAEMLSLSQGVNLTPLTVAFVVLTFLGQAFFGAAILASGLLPAWIGWLTILWNLGWLVILPIARPHDIYYPWLFYIAPLVIGISLLVRK